MDVWNIFSIERRSAFLRFRLVDDDFDDVLSGEKRSSMVDSEDFGEEDIALKKKSKRTSSSSSSSSKPLRNNTSSQRTTKKERKRFGRQKERENLYMTGVFSAFFFVSFFKLFLTKVFFFSRYKKFFPYSKR